MDGEHEGVLVVGTSQAGRGALLESGSHSIIRRGSGICLMVNVWDAPLIEQCGKG